MTFDPHKNFGYSTVATAPSPASSGTSLVLFAGDGALFPTTADGSYQITVWPAGTAPLATNAEICRVTARSTDTLTITRAQEGSSARSIVVGDQVALTITKKVVTDIEAATLPEITANTQTASYTLVLADAGKCVEMNSASALNLTVPPNSSVAFDVGTVIEVYAKGAGVVTVVAGSGVTIRNVGNLAAQYATARLRKIATDEWVLSGELA